MATYSRQASETTAYNRVNLRQFDRENSVGHWRGFTKFLQPNGGVVACSSETDEEGFALGPARDGRAADVLIEAFYADEWSKTPA